MGKVSPKDRESKTPKQRRRTRASSNPKYLRPGALAQLRYVKSASLKSSSDLLAHMYMVKQNSLPRTPRTPRIEDSVSDSRLESLPVDVLVKILCHLHHDQLKAVFHVSQRIRMAAVLARQFHFNYTTPDRSRQEMLQTMIPFHTEICPSLRCGEGEDKAFQMPNPHTPKAPRHGPRPPSRLKYTEMRQVAAALFQESTIPSRCIVPSVLSKSQCKTRVLFYEDELCQAVAQNKLL